MMLIVGNGQETAAACKCMFVVNLNMHIHIRVVSAGNVCLSVNQSTPQGPHEDLHNDTLVCELCMQRLLYI